MGLKYYMPDNYENLAACEGLYVENEVFFGIKAPNETEWDKAIADLSLKLSRFISGVNPINEWKSGMGIRRYVLASDYRELVQIVLGDDERYISVFVIIPENCADIDGAKRKFGEAYKAAKSYLSKKFPNAVYKRKNTWNLELIGKGEEYAGRKPLLS